MAIYVNTSNPQSLVDGIKQQIKEGKIDAWLCDDDGDFTHNNEQWRYKAWMRPVVETERVVFGVLCRKDKNLSVVDYAIYHGRFVEMLLTHFDKDCSDIKVSPLATKYDTIRASKE